MPPGLSDLKRAWKERKHRKRDSGSSSETGSSSSFVSLPHSLSSATSYDSNDEPKYVGNCDHGGRTPVMIAVMGVTGAGKSTFIKTLTGKDVQIGHKMNSCTQDVKEFTFTLNNSCVHLIDTPGFDDTHNKDTETLQLICDYLAASYRSHIKLSAIIYMHPINIPRMGGTALRNFQMFKKLCGDKPAENVVFCTNFWEGLDCNEIGEQREEELKLGFWKPMMERGSTMERFYRDDREHAVEIIKRYLDNRPITLDIQREIVVEKKTLIETQAGATLNAEIIRLQKEHAAQLQRVKADLEEAMRQKDQDFQEALEEERRETASQLEALKNAQLKLKQDSRQEREELKKRLREQEKKGEKTARDLMDQMKKEKSEAAAQFEKKLDEERKRERQSKEVELRRERQLREDTSKKHQKDFETMVVQAGQQLSQTVHKMKQEQDLMVQRMEAEQQYSEQVLQYSLQQTQMHLQHQNQQAERQQEELRYERQCRDAERAAERAEMYQRQREQQQVINNLHADNQAASANAQKLHSELNRTREAHRAAADRLEYINNRGVIRGILGGGRDALLNKVR